MKWPWRSDRKFREQEPRVRRVSDQPAFRYFPEGNSGGVSIDRIPPGSRMADSFKAEFGIEVEVAASIPGWRPHTKGA